MKFDRLGAETQSDVEKRIRTKSQVAREQNDRIMKLCKKNERYKSRLWRKIAIEITLNSISPTARYCLIRSSRCEIEKYKYHVNKHTDSINKL